jgi:hypothetical protein
MLYGPNSTRVVFGATIAHANGLQGSRKTGPSTVHGIWRAGLLRGLECESTDNLGLGQNNQWWLDPLAERHGKSSDLLIEPVFFCIEIKSATGLRAIEAP